MLFRLRKVVYTGSCDQGWLYLEIFRHNPIWVLLWAIPISCIRNF